MQNKSIIDEIIKLENLHWAWEKLKDFYREDNFWSDDLKLVDFQVHYEQNLKEIKEKLQNGTYLLSSIRPIFFPKTKDSEGNIVNRQMFWVSIQDQLVWLAVMNVIGKYYDKQMPYWSYGNRLYINIFPDKNKSTNEKIHWEYGPYRNTSKKIYRSFGQSWPRYRKDIYITSKVMTKSNEELKEQLSDEEQDDIERNEQLHKIHKVDYKEKTFWSKDYKDEIYWCSIDLSKFYPNASTSTILKNFKKYGDPLKKRFNDFERLTALLRNLLSFEIDYDMGITNADFDKILLPNKEKSFKGIPTGLFSAGFLSNIAMLHVDKTLDKIIQEKSKTLEKVALFRFVDDFTILTPNFSSILPLIDEINKSLDIEFENKLYINKEKTKPDELRDLLICEDPTKTSELLEKAKLSMKLDASFPTPLMNHTLKKMSMSNRVSFELMDSDEDRKFIQDIEHLLITDISEDEIRKDTRLSFASSKLSILVPKKKYDYSEIYNVKCKIKDIKESIFKLKKTNDNEKIAKLKEELKSTFEELEFKKEDLNKEIQKDRKKVSLLLEYAIKNYPDKLKLWKNLISFYKNIGFSKGEYLELLQIFKILKDMNIDNKINNFTHEYLITYIYDVIANALISCIKALKSENIPNREKEIKTSFLTQIFNDEVQKKLNAPNGTLIYSSFYFKQSKELLDISMEICRYYFYDDYILSIKLNQIQYCWLSTKLDVELSKPFIREYLEENDLKNSYSYYLASLFPTIKLKNLNEILLIEQNNYFSFAWWYEYFNEHDYSQVISEFNNINAKNAKIFIEYQYKSEYENIFSIIKSGKYNENKALEIVDKIIQEYNVSSQSLFETTNERVTFQFPYNIYIKNNPKNVKLNILNINDVNIQDKRYFPDFVDFNCTEGDEKQFIYGIGILLYQLVSKDLKLPTSFYQPSMQLINSNYFIKELEKYPISSFTYEIIKACLSKRNREIVNLNIENEEDNDFFDDKKNVINISTVDGLEKYMKKALEFLNNQTYQYQNITRSLIPKKLFELNSDFTNNTIQDTKENLKIGFIQINFDSMAAWGPSNDITLHIKPLIEDYIWQEVLKGFHKMNNHHTKPDIIVIPELTIPKSYINKLKELAKEINAVVFAGLDWFVDNINNKIENKAIMVVPNNWNTPLNSFFCNTTLLGKKNPANVEKITIDSFNRNNKLREPYVFSSDENMYLVDTGEFGKIGFAICADFYDIDRFVVYKGKVQHIIILALNKDTNSFFAISEAVARLVMCNVVICNTGEFGDSLAFSPYKKDYKRMIYRNQGAKLFATQVVTLPVNKLIEDQKKGASTQTMDESKYFKMPPEYKLYI